MAWVKLDDQFADHPKIALAGPLAGWLHVKALVYCNRYLTDGFIPRAVAVGLVSWDEVAPLRSAFSTDALSSEQVTLALINRLLEHRIWEEREGGYAIHDFLEYNQSREQVLATRALRSAVGALGGRKSGEMRHREANGQANAKQTVKQTRSKHEAKSNPDPDPIPDPRSESEKNQTKPDRKKLAANESPPLPFTLKAALEELARASGGRFVVQKQLRPGQAVNLTRLIRQFPALSTWTLVAEWLAAGGESWRETVDARALSDLASWVAHAEKWQEGGRPALGKPSLKPPSRGTSMTVETQQKIASLWGTNAGR